MLLLLAKVILRRFEYFCLNLIAHQSAMPPSLVVSEPYVTSTPCPRFIGQSVLALASFVFQWQIETILFIAALSKEPRQVKPLLPSFLGLI
jgi:hypothetical protein